MIPVEVRMITQDETHDAVAECAYLENAVHELCVAHQATLKSDSVEGINGSDIDSAISFGPSISPEDTDNDYEQDDDADDDILDDEFDDDDTDIDSIAGTCDGDEYDKLDTWDDLDDEAAEF